MGKTEYISELCEVCSKLLLIVQAQSDALAQVGAVVMEEEKAAVAEQYASLLGDNGKAKEDDA